MRRLYTSDDLGRIDIDKFVTDRPEMIFGADGPTPRSIAMNLAETAFILGASSTSVSLRKEWWVVSANLDWLAAHSRVPTTIETVFWKLLAFPEAGDNCFRWEILTRIYADSVVTFSNAESDVSVITGSGIDAFTRESLIPSEKWERIVAFKFNKNRYNKDLQDNLYRSRSGGA